MINVSIQERDRLKPRISVVGVGGAGCNAVNNMIHSNLEGCEFLVCNTDAQALEGNAATNKVQLGENVTRGLGAGANPEIGRAAAEESLDQILSYLEGSNMVFVTAGMGGGTGTGAAPVIAQTARQAGILTVGVVTKPFHFEGTHRMKLAESGIAELQKHVDTLIIIPNQNLFRIANEKTTFSDAFRMADEVLQSGVRGVTDLMVMPGLINLDFADIRAVMAEMGKAMMGTGEAHGERRAVEAAESAISNPLLDDISMKGAKGVLINITGGMDMTLFEVDEAANRIRDEVDPDANIIFGSTFDPSLEGMMRVSVVATGIDAEIGVRAQPAHYGVNAQQARARATAQPQAHVQQQPQPQTYAAAPVAETPAPSRVTVKPAAAVSGTSGGYGAVRGPSPSIPASIIPGARPEMYPVAHQAGAVTAGGGSEPVAAAPAVETGVATPAAGYAQTATARKLEDDIDTSSTWSRPMTQNYTRPVPSPASQPAGQPRAARVGGSFIPPRPVDPRVEMPMDSEAAAEAVFAAPATDLFGSAPVAAPSVPSEAADMTAGPKAAPRVAEPVRKSPSIFERFSLQREKPRAEPVAAAAPVQVEGTPLSVHTGKADGDDELDIPAFLRRQAN